MRRFALVLMLALSGCGYVDQAADMLIGLKRQTAPLIGATTINSNGVFIKHPRIEVLGKDSSVCVSLHDSPSDDLQMSATSNPLRLLGESTLSGYMLLKDGQKVAFVSVGKEPSAYGQGVDPEDPSICLFPEEDWKVEVGQVVDTIVIQATPEIRVRGLYWESMNTDELFKERS